MVSKPVKHWFAGVVTKEEIASLAEKGSAQEESFRQEWKYTNSHTYRWILWAIEQVADRYIKAVGGDPIAKEIIESPYFGGVWFRSPLISGRATPCELLTHYLKYLVLEVDVPKDLQKQVGFAMLLYSPQKRAWMNEEGAQAFEKLMKVKA